MNGLNKKKLKSIIMGIKICTSQNFIIIQYLDTQTSISCPSLHIVTSYFYASLQCWTNRNINFLFCRYQKHHWFRIQVTQQSLLLRGLMTFLFGCLRKLLVAAGSSQTEVIVHLMIRSVMHSYGTSYLLVVENFPLAITPIN